MARSVTLNIPRPDPAIIQCYLAIQTGLISMRMGISQVMDPGIKPLGDEWFVCGPAFTVRLEAVDVLMPAAAADWCEPGDVIVIGAGGRADAAVWGMSLTQNAKRRGANGVVIDGALEMYQPEGIARPANDGWAEAGLPIFTRHVTPFVNGFAAPGSLNVPIACGGVVVNPGDLVLGNRHHITVVPQPEIATFIDSMEADLAAVVARQAQAATQNKSLFERRGGKQQLVDLGVTFLD